MTQSDLFGGGSPPVLYQAATKEEALPHVPHSMLALLEELPCGRCGVALLAVREALASMREVARRAGRGFVAVCPDCARKQPPSDPTWLMTIHDQDIRDELDRHNAEKN